MITSIPSLSLARSGQDFSYLVLDSSALGAKFLLARAPDPGHESSNRTRQGYARKRILKPAGRFFSGYGMEGGRP